MFFLCGKWAPSRFPRLVVKSCARMEVVSSVGQFKHLKLQISDMDHF